jgi:hypothetical protein
MIACRPTSWNAMFCAEWPIACAARIARGPLQHLHAAHRAADHAEQVRDAEMVEECRLHAHHVGDGDHREVEVPWLASGGIARLRAGRAHAVAQHVDADDVEARRIEDLARSDQALPPALLACDGMRLGDELVAGQRMTDKDGIALGRVQLAVGLVGHAIGAEIDAAVEAQRAVCPQDRVAALGERLAFGICEVVEHRFLKLLKRKAPDRKSGAFRALRPFSGV